MQLIDYIVTYSLEVNNRCLRYLAECETGLETESLAGGQKAHDISGEPHMVYAESLLARESRRILSLWRLVSQGDSDAALDSHLDGLEDAIGSLSDATAMRRLTLRLAAIAPEDEEAQALLAVTRALPVEPDLSWSGLSDLFSDDSSFWRNWSGMGHNTEQRISERAQRSYRKAYKHNKRLLEHLQAHQQERGPVSDWYTESGGKFAFWVQQSAHQLELFRPGLSEKGKSQVWYTDKLADSLRMREGFESLIAQLQAPAEQTEIVIPGLTRQIAVKFATKQLSKMDKRISRLQKSTFKLKPKKFSALIDRSLASLGIQQIATIKPVASGFDENTPSAVQPDS